VLGVVLYGPPAAGKDSITQVLTELDPRFELFPRVKVGDGRILGYQRESEASLSRLRDAGEVVWENRRYGATYAIIHSTLVTHLSEHISVVHLGQLPAVEAVVSAVPQASWLVVQVWCPRDVAARRIAERGTGDDAARLEAWDETPPLPDASMTIDTSETSAIDAAAAIHVLVSAHIRRE
jgi:guanylate kinase